MKLTPLHDWVLIRTREPSEKSAGGIIIPDTAQEKPEEGEVLAVGTGRLIEDKDSKEKIKKKTFVKTTLQPGEHVLYKKYAATPVEGDDEKLVLVREEDVLGYFRKSIFPEIDTHCSNMLGNSPEEILC